MPEELTPEQVNEYWTRLGGMKQQFESFAKSYIKTLDQCVSILSPYARACTRLCVCVSVRLCVCVSVCLCVCACVPRE